MVASPLHLHRHRARPGVHLVVADAVTAAARTPLPGHRQRGGRRHRLRPRRVRGVAGAVHALEGHQPARAAVRVDRTCGCRRYRPDPDDHLVPRLAGRCPRPQRCAAAWVLGSPADRSAVDRRAVHLRRNRATDRQIGALLGASAGTLCAAAGFGRCGGGLTARVDGRAAQRRRGAVRDEHHQQDLLCGERRDRPGVPGADVATALRRSAIAGQLGVTWSSGPGVRLGRPDRRGAHQVQRQAGDRADPRLRRPAFRPRHQGDRPTGRRRAAPYRWAGPRRRRRRHHYRHRLDQRGGGLRAGVHVQRQHRDREHAVLVPAQLAVVPGGQRERAPGRAGAIRGRRRDGQGAARGPAPQTRRIRRKPGLLRR